jgi:hypothetical protein
MIAAANKRPSISAVAAAPVETPVLKSIKNNKTGEGNSKSKQSRVVAMLQSPNGTTITKMMKTTGWQKHSVRGFLTVVVRNRLKLKLTSKKVDGDRVYQVTGVASAVKSRRRGSKTRSR